MTQTADLRIDDAWVDALPPWLGMLATAGVTRVAVVGGSGRLGSLLTYLLVTAGVEVHVLDSSPCQALPGVRYVPCQLGSARGIDPEAFKGAQAVVHLGALHGAHLLAGVPRGDFWKVNVRGTEQVLSAAATAGVQTAVLASSTSIYGSGSPDGEPAYVLNEESTLAPEDVYDLTKVSAELLLRQWCATDGRGVALRFGRFFFPSQAGYHLRKLSTGLDARDACQAIARSLSLPAAGFSAYCIASDLPLDRTQRQRLGLSVPDVLADALPEFLDAARRRRIPLPTRVGKSVDSSLARAELNYSAERALDWVARIWLRETPPTSRRRLPAQRWLDAAV
jgi:UDP-glucose 4-epimerase